MTIKKINFDDIAKQEELENSSNDKYELLKNGLDEIINSSSYEELKDTKLNITYNELQLYNIDNNIENIDIDALSKMKKYTSNLGVELTEAFEKELSKNPETAKDNILELNEKLEYNLEILREKEPYIEDSILFAKNFNELAISVVGNEYDKLPDETRRIFDKNEELLFITNDALFIEDNFEYLKSLPNITIDVENNFELIKNDFDIAVDSYRLFIETGFVPENDNYLNEKINETIENIAIYSIDEEHTLEDRIENFKGYIKEKDAYIETNIPNIDKSLINLIENIRVEDFSKENKKEEMIISKKEIEFEKEIEEETDFGFEI